MERDDRDDGQRFQATAAKLFTKVDAAREIHSVEELQALTQRLSREHAAMKDLLTRLESGNHNAMWTEVRTLLATIGKE